MLPITSVDFELQWNNGSVILIDRKVKNSLLLMIVQKMMFFSRCSLNVRSTAFTFVNVWPLIITLWKEKFITQILLKWTNTNSTKHKRTIISQIKEKLRYENFRIHYICHKFHSGTGSFVSIQDVRTSLQFWKIIVRVRTVRMNLVEGDRF